MKAAKATSGDASRNPTVGKIEAAVGSGVGCEGMVEEGRKAEREG